MCPNNIPVFECGGDPCNGASCPGYPDAVCLPDYCGHCHAVWYVGGERVTCSGKQKKHQLQHILRYCCKGNNVIIILHAEKVLKYCFIKSNIVYGYV